MADLHATRVTDADFASFLDEVAREVEAHVDPWRVRVGEAVARWQAEDVATAVLERALALPAEPDVDGLLATFAAAVGRLRTLEGEAAAHDPSLRGHAAFRDPARLAEAQALVQRAVRASARPPRAPLVDRQPPRPSPALASAALSAALGAGGTGVPALELDPETFVVHWADVGALLVEEYR
jgi:hypothetical protein